MRAVTPTRTKRQWSRGAAAAAAGAGLVLGAVVAPMPALAASPNGCITLWHTSGITTQTEYGRNDCRSGTYGFQVYSWSSISSEWSDCLRVSPGQTKGWKWTRGRSNFRVYAC